MMTALDHSRAENYFLWTAKFYCAECPKYAKPTDTSYHPAQQWLSWSQCSLVCSAC